MYLCAISIAELLLPLTFRLFSVSSSSSSLKLSIGGFHVMHSDKLSKRTFPVSVTSFELLRCQCYTDMCMSVANGLHIFVKLSAGIQNCCHFSCDEIRGNYAAPKIATSIGWVSSFFSALISKIECVCCRRVA